MADVRRAKRSLGQSADGDDPSPLREMASKHDTALDLGGSRRAIRRVAARMGRHHVPEQDAFLEPELGENALHHGRGRLCRAGTGQLALRRERDPGHPRATVAGRLADEKQLRRRSVLQVCPEPLSQKRRADAVAVLVERFADAGGGKALDKVVHERIVAR